MATPIADDVSGIAEAMRRIREEESRPAVGLEIPPADTAKAVADYYSALAIDRLDPAFVTNTEYSGIAAVD